jgi:YD repeat-containing protein
LRGGKFRKYIWNGALGLPLATAVMPQNGSFFFTSFEYPSEYATGLLTNAVHFSGNYAYQFNGMNNINLLGFNSNTGVEVYAWATGGSFSANGIAAISTGRTKGAWTLYRVNLGGPVTTVSISGTTATIDQLVILPSAASFRGNVYDASNRVIATVDEQMSTSFYEYDNFGRLTIVRDEQGNIIKSSSYQYQAAQ